MSVPRSFIRRLFFSSMTKPVVFFVALFDSIYKCGIHHSPDASRKKFENLAHVIPHFFARCALSSSRVMATHNDGQKTPLRPARDDVLRDDDDDFDDDGRKKKKKVLLALLEGKRNAIERWERSLGRPATREDVVKDERMRTMCREYKTLLHDLEEEKKKTLKTKTKTTTGSKDENNTPTTRDDVRDDSDEVRPKEDFENVQQLKTKKNYYKVEDEDEDEVVEATPPKKRRREVFCNNNNTNKNTIEEKKDDETTTIQRKKRRKMR